MNYGVMAGSKNQSMISGNKNSKKPTPRPGGKAGVPTASFAFTPEGILKNLTKDIVKRPKAAKRKMFREMN